MEGSLIESWTRHAMSRYAGVTEGLIAKCQLDFRAGRDLGRSIPNMGAATAEIIVAESLEADRLLETDLFELVALPTTELSDWSLAVLDDWSSAATKATYPIRWRLRLPSEGLDLEIAALMQEQENVSRRSGGLHYWEGAVATTAAGEPVGCGYVELTGYGEGNRPPI